MSRLVEESLEFEYFSSKSGSMKKKKPRLPKNHFTNSFIRRSVLEDNRETAEGETLPLPKEDSGIESVNVVYSLNKRARWKLVERFRKDLTQLQDTRNGVRVSAIEQQFLGEDFRCAKRRTTGYHTVENKENNEIHRTPNGTFAQELTFTNKERPPKKKNRRLPNPPGAGRNRNRGQPFQGQRKEHVTESESRPEIIHVRYDVTTPCAVSPLVHGNMKDTAHFERIRNTCSSGRRISKDPDCTEQTTAETVIESDYYSEDEDTEFIDDGSLPVSSQSSTFSLLDFITTNDGGRKSDKKRRKKTNMSETSDSSVDSGFEFVEKSLIRQISRDDSYIPQKFRLRDQRRNQPGPSGQPNVRLEIPRYFEMIPVTVEIPEEFLFPDVLKEEFGSKYFEVSCIPRRFCVDISESVRNVMIVSHGGKAEPCKIHVLVIFQVALPTLAHFKLMDSSVTPWENVKIWVNGLFTRDLLHVSMRDVVEDGATQTPGNILKAAALRIGTLPLNFFEVSNTRYAVSRKNSLAEGVIEDHLRPKSKCLLQEEAAQLALSESNFSKNLQRQLTAVEQYPWFADDEDSQCQICLDFPVREIGMCMAECKHWFCTQCWTRYCSMQIQNGRVPIRCPEPDCEQLVDYDTLTSLLPLPVCRRYAFLLRDQHLISHGSNWMWCPNSRCGRIVRIEERGNSDVLTCVCGNLWCSQCSKDVHWPVSCHHADLYMKKVKANGHDMRIRSWGQEHTVSVKQCPLCFTKMEKGQGCNYMACRCGGAFCWQCLQDIKNHDQKFCERAGKKSLNGVGWKPFVIVNTEDTPCSLNLWNGNSGHDLCLREMKYDDKVVDVKRCPHCSLPMQKGFGCNHIICRCGRDFCWCCLSQWDGGRHYNCKPENNHEHVALRDVAKGVDNVMSKDFYLRSVGHRQAAFPEKVQALKKAIHACLTHKHLGFLQEAEIHFRTIDVTCTEEFLKAQIIVAKDFVQSFLRLHQQVHYFLEHTYVWLYFSTRKGCDEYYGLLRAADRLNFVVYRAEEACFDGKFRKVAKLKMLAEDLLKKIVIQILMVKKREKHREIQNN